MAKNNTVEGLILIPLEVSKDILRHGQSHWGGGAGEEIYQNLALAQFHNAVYRGKFLPGPNRDHFTPQSTRFDYSYLSSPVMYSDKVA